MKRYSLAVVFLGLAAMLLALAPQVRADGIDHFNYSDHSNAVVSGSNGDVTHAADWRSDDALNTAKSMCMGMGNHDNNNGNTGSGNGNNGGTGNTGSNTGGNTGSGTTSSSTTPEPSSLILLLSALMAGAVGLALKKVVA
jgi:hypothetical protein